MSQFEFKCPQCGKSLEADDALRGQVGECPHCGKGIVIPRQDKNDEGERTEASFIPEEDFLEALASCRQDEDFEKIFAGASKAGRLFLGLRAYCSHFSKGLDDVEVRDCLKDIESDLTADDVNYLFEHEGDPAVREYLSGLFKKVNAQDGIGPVGGGNHLQQKSDSNESRLNDSRQGGASSLATRLLLRVKGCGGFLQRLVLGLLNAPIPIAVPFIYFITWLLGYAFLSSDAYDDRLAATCIAVIVSLILLILYPSVKGRIVLTVFLSVCAGHDIYKELFRHSFSWLFEYRNESLASLCLLVLLWCGPWWKWRYSRSLADCRHYLGWALKFAIPLALVFFQLRLDSRHDAMIGLGSGPRVGQKLDGSDFDDLKFVEESSLYNQDFVTYKKKVCNEHYLYYHGLISTERERMGYDADFFVHVFKSGIVFGTEISVTASKPFCHLGDKSRMKKIGLKILRSMVNDEGSSWLRRNGKNWRKFEDYDKFLERVGNVKVAENFFSADFLLDEKRGKGYSVNVTIQSWRISVIDFEEWKEADNVEKTKRREKESARFR